MCYENDDPAAFYREGDVKARKEHLCSECRRVILEKEIYRRVSALWGNRISVYKTCSDCLIPQEWLRKECGSFMHENLEDDILEHAIEYRKIFLYRWVIGIRKKWQRKC